MATLTEYFETEARESMTQLDDALAQAQPDAAVLLRVARALRGNAQMARQDRVFRAASAFEAAARALVGNRLSWSADTAARARTSVDDLRMLIAAGEDDAALDARADAVVDRWRTAGVELPAQLGGRADVPGTDGVREFREFAGREVAGISDALATGVQQLAAAPMDREVLKAILRRQRALLGAARLDEIPVVAEILRAIEDLTRVIAKLDVPVKQEWLDIYRVAREGLKGAVDPLQRGDNPPPTHALSRLRHMREELIERYGAGEEVAAADTTGAFVPPRQVYEPPGAVSVAPAAVPADDDVLELTGADIVEEADTAHEDQDRDDAPDLIAAAALAMQRAVGVATTAVAAGMQTAAHVVESVAQAVAPPAPASSDDVVPIESLLYTRESALRRALELRATVARVAANDTQANEAVEELFDLIRIAQS